MKNNNNFYRFKYLKIVNKLNYPLFVKAVSFIKTQDN